LGEVFEVTPVLTGQRSVLATTKASRADGEGRRWRGESGGMSEEGDSVVVGEGSVVSDPSAERLHCPNPRLKKAHTLAS
jgi:hypothetical protein